MNENELNDKDIDLSLEKTLKPLIDIKPDEGFRNDLKYRFMEKVKTESAKKPVKEYTARSLFLLPRFKRSLIAVAAILVLSIGTAVASTGTMPDSPLYPVKKAMESVSKAISNDKAKALKILEFNYRRVQEIKYLKETGDIKQVPDLMREINQNIKEIKSISAKLPFGERQEIAVGVDRFVKENKSFAPEHDKKIEEKGQKRTKGITEESDKAGKASENKSVGGTGEAKGKKPVSPGTQGESKSKNDNADKTKKPKGKK